jgi:hypothetical protein
MKILMAFPLFCLVVTAASASDINPSKQTLPDKFVNPPGKRYSIFAGDPERVQRANEVNIKDFSAELSVEPKSLSISGQVAEGAAPNQFKISFKIKNTSKKKVTLSFPDAQRYDIAVNSSDGRLVYLWSADKMYVQTEGISFVNGGESITFIDFLPLELIKDKMPPGSYTVQMILANYPEVTATTNFQLIP